jgi:hypothetical protein
MAGLPFGPNELHPLAELYFTLVNRYNIVPLIFRVGEDPVERLLAIDTSQTGAINVDWISRTGASFKDGKINTYSGGEFQLWYRAWGPDHGMTDETELGSTSLVYVAAGIVTTVLQEHKRLADIERAIEETMH